MWCCCNFTIGEAVIPECLYRVILVYGIQLHELTGKVVIWHLWCCCTMKFERNCCLVKDDSFCLCFHQVLVLTTQNIGCENLTKLSYWGEIRIGSWILLSRAWDIWHLLFCFLGTCPYWVGEWYFSLKWANPQLIPEKLLQPKWVKSESFHDQL